MASLFCTGLHKVYTMYIFPHISNHSNYINGIFNSLRIYEYILHGACRYGCQSGASVLYIVAVLIERRTWWTGHFVCLKQKKRRTTVNRHIRIVLRTVFKIIPEVDRAWCDAFDRMGTWSAPNWDDFFHISANVWRSEPSSLRARYYTGTWPSHRIQEYCPFLFNQNWSACFDCFACNVLDEMSIRFLGNDSVNAVTVVLNAICCSTILMNSDNRKLRAHWTHSSGN